MAITTGEGFSVPVRSPLQPLNAYPAAGVAVKLTTAPELKLVPSGDQDTLPPPPADARLTYGADPVLARELGLDRQWLHAVGLGFQHPGSGERVDFSSPYPLDLQTALDRVTS